MDGIVAHAERGGGGTPAPSFEDLCDQHAAALWRLTAAYARQRADREDLYQEILFAIWKALPRFRGDASIRTFVFRIGHNRGLTCRARLALRRKREEEVPDEIEDRRPVPSTLLAQEEERDRLVRAIAGLPTTLAQPVMLHLEGLSHAEIGEVLGITENNVGVRMSRARAALARILTPETR